MDVERLSNIRRKGVKWISVFCFVCFFWCYNPLAHKTGKTYVIQYHQPLYLNLYFHIYDIICRSSSAAGFGNDLIILRHSFPEITFVNDFESKSLAPRCYFSIALHSTVGMQ